MGLWPALFYPEEMNHLLQNINRSAVAGLWLFVLFLSSAQGAQYSLFAENLDTQSLLAQSQAASPLHFKNVHRTRRINLAPGVSLPHLLVQGDVLTLNLFADAAYTARIDRISTNVNGTISIRARLDNYPLGYLLISTTHNESMGLISIPEKSLQYGIEKNPGTGTHCLFEMNADGIDQLQDRSPLIPPVSMSLGATQVDALENTVTNDPLDPDNIDVMIVYTPAAMSWAGGQSGIDNVIAQAMEKAQLALDNSAACLTMTLTHSALVDYTESGSSNTDLDRLTNKTDGYMDDVHTWRYVYKADLVALFANVEDTGGLGWDLNSTSGSPNYAFCLNRVQQTGWTYTLIHEFGHTMGCDHRKDQVTQPGPGLFSYSAGWRWNGNDGGKYCDVMSYEDDGYSRVGYFSNPDILYQGAATGDAADGDNARTIRETKHVVAAYRGPTGSLRIVLSPQDAIDVGARWRRVGTTTWYNSGDTELYISQGSCTVEFKNAPGWSKPANLSVTINENQLTEIAASYTIVPEIIIGTGTSTWEFPLAAFYHDARTQTIYWASEIGSARNIVGLGLYVTTIPGQVMNNFTVRLKHTDLNVYGSLPNWDSSGWTTVYQANEEITAAGWVQFNFIAPFVYNGAQNLMADISFNNGYYTSDGYCRSTSTVGKRTLYCRADSNPDNPLTWSGRSPTPTTSVRVPNIKLITTSIVCQIGDLDGTCGVDWQDLAFYASHWLEIGCTGPDWCGGADLNQSSNVDLADFVILGQHWLEGNVQYRPYDIVPDGKIDINDLMVLIDQWLDVPGIPSADIAPETPDNFVNFEDFALLSAHWLEGM
jgi:hypothetical protein